MLQWYLATMQEYLRHGSVFVDVLSILMGCPELRTVDHLINPLMGEEGCSVVMLQWYLATKQEYLLHGSVFTSFLSIPLGWHATNQEGLLHVIVFINAVNCVTFVEL